MSRSWPKQDPAEDKHLVGITFVDVLFALVIAQVLEPFKDASTVPAEARAQLILIGTLTLLSWIGYHNSLNRPTYFIRFPNLPLFQLLIDVALVVIYWFGTVSAEKPHTTASTRPELILIAASFVLYVAWDYVGYRIRKDPRYGLRPKDRDVKARRDVTSVFAGLAVIIALVVGIWWNPHSRTAVLWIDYGMILFLVAYRLFKEWRTDPRDRPEKKSQSLSLELRVGADTAIRDGDRIVFVPDGAE